MGRYQWLKCKVNSNDPNCIEHKGPIIDVAGQPKRLPARVAKDIDHIDSSEESSESGDGSGDFSLFNIPELRRVAREIITEVSQNPVQNEEEGSAFDSDYSNSLTPEIKSKLSAQDLLEDNMIE
ncbi:serglycin precursor [Silurus asotus]|uniref:Serglycin n=1 Tax=Silurus asotus TaxID=30991 RepID=A0AAD5AIX6_SILAS|nr:serglycin precursor [Silurus asotus]